MVEPLLGEDELRILRILKAEGPLKLVYTPDEVNPLVGVSGRSLDELPETYGELNHALNRLEGWGLVSLEILPTREHEYTISPAGEEALSRSPLPATDAEDAPGSSSP